MPIPEAKVRSEMMRKARSELQTGHQTLIGGSYLPLGHAWKVHRAFGRRLHRRPASGLIWIADSARDYLGGSPDLSAFLGDVVSDMARAPYITITQDLLALSAPQLLLADSDTRVSGWASRAETLEASKSYMTSTAPALSASARVSGLGT